MTFVQLKPFLKNPIRIFSRGKKVPREKFPSGKMGKISHGKKSHLAKWEKFPTGKNSHLAKWEKFPTGKNKY